MVSRFNRLIIASSPIRAGTGSSITTSAISEQSVAVNIKTIINNSKATAVVVKTTIYDEMQKPVQTRSATASLSRGTRQLVAGVFSCCYQT